MAGMEPTFVHCPDCGSEHLGSACGMTYIERLRSVKLDPSAAPTRTRRNYYDSDAIDAQFGGTGAERKEQMLDASGGLGYIKPDAEGRYFHRDRRTGEVQPVSDRDLARLTRTEG